jgi:hypothetical protein
MRAARTTHYSDKNKPALEPVYLFSRRFIYLRLSHHRRQPLQPFIQRETRSEKAMGVTGSEAWEK